MSSSRLFPLSRRTIERFFTERADIALPEQLNKDERYGHYLKFFDWLMNSFTGGDESDKKHEMLEDVATISEGGIDILGVYTLEAHSRGLSLPNIPESAPLELVTMMRQNEEEKIFQALARMKKEEPLLSKIAILKVCSLEGTMRPTEQNDYLGNYLSGIEYGRFILALAYESQAQ